MDVVGARKRGRSEAAFNGNGGIKKFKPEMESFTTGLGSKTKPCTKFFSFCKRNPCDFTNELGSQSCDTAPLAVHLGRHVISCTMFLVASKLSLRRLMLVATLLHNLVEILQFHHPLQTALLLQLLKLDCATSIIQLKVANLVINATLPMESGSLASLRFHHMKILVPWDKCKGRLVAGLNRHLQLMELQPALEPLLLLRDHDSDPNLKNIELEGSFDQIKQASVMVRELIANVGSVSRPSMKNITAHASAPMSNLKTKLCEKFAKGSCTFGEKCHFAHGADELRKPVI